MPTAKHEGLIELFRHRPSLAAELAEMLGVKLPAWQEAREGSGELPDLVPTQRLADAVVTLYDRTGRPALAFVVEVQLGRDEEKLWSWPTPAPQQRGVLEALLVAYGVIDRQRASPYHDVVLKALPAAARRYLEELMATGTYEYQSDFARHYFGQGKEEGIAEGRVEGEVEALLEVLAARGIEVPDDLRARITGCTDLEQLRTWVRRAVTANSAQDIFR